ncbi:D-glycero-alpha-D-manno-heptose-1,7-bisphosphate 7-phosphatase [Larkinella sp. VNQ87]|uniref:D-glycero-alpha-D-manno-heptose-1,7-bisphosphate 7-phosphatase n=1 Tax=Larkinella sp. VNQ87 TaxID=3400921 RepID=UPI003BFC5D02
MKAVFIDKDGTLIPDIPYNVEPERITLYAGTGLALQRLQEAGYALIVISNQSGIALGYFPELSLEGVRNRLTTLLEPYGVRLTGFYYCPHHPAGTVLNYAITCNCRKPAPGLLQQAARDHGIDLLNSWMIGDILNDAEAGNRAGCRTILLDNGHETEWLSGPYRQPTQTVRDWDDIPNLILGQASDKQPPNAEQALYETNQSS